MGSSPTFPKMPYNTYAYVINHVNIALSKKQFYSSIIFTKNSLSLIKALYTTSYINNYIITKDSRLSQLKVASKGNFSTKKLNRTRIKFSILYFKNKSFFKSIRLISTPSRKHTITLRALKMASLSIKSSIILLSTNKGIIDHNEAIKLGIGGTILCVLS